MEGNWPVLRIFRLQVELMPSLCIFPLLPPLFFSLLNESLTHTHTETLCPFHFIFLYQGQVFLSPQPSPAYTVHRLCVLLTRQIRHIHTAGSEQPRLHRELLCRLLLRDQGGNAAFCINAPIFIFFKAFCCGES